MMIEMGVAKGWGLRLMIMHVVCMGCAYET